MAINDTGRTTWKGSTFAVVKVSLTSSAVMTTPVSEVVENSNSTEGKPVSLVVLTETTDSVDR